ETWDGYTVFQAKHKDRLEAKPADNAAWLWTQVRKELDAWGNPGSDRDPVPNYLVIVTNVPLTPTPGSGGFDTVNASIQTYLDLLADGTRDANDRATAARKRRQRRMSRLRAWRIWDGNQVDGLITKHQSVRRAFGAFLTVPDVFAHLAEFTDKLPLHELEGGLRRHARAALIGDRSIYFDEAGSGGGEGTPIDQVAIDLPITIGPGGERRTVFGHILDRADQVLKPRMSSCEGPKHVVVAGSAGNGKTTMSRFLVQAYRAALLDGATDLGPEHERVITATERALRDLGRDGLPRFRRWPMRIDLAEYAEEKGLSEDSTLLRWIAHKVSERSNVGTVTPSALDSWMKQWPWLLVLDGLDEVTEPRIRKRLIRQITEFVSEAEGDNCDLLVVVTTRPTGYVENIAPTQFERIDLARLDIDEALRYGIHTTKVRLKDDDEKIERIAKQLRRAADDESLRHLMQTPLQVLIMTIIVEGAGQLAPDRYSLFWGYYDTVFKRERLKQTTLALLLQEHASTILTLHQRVGFELQVRSESDGSMALMRPEELRAVAWQVLHDSGFRPSDVDADLLERIVTAATDRLVLLTPMSRGQDGLGFDVRSLQELMAARFLTTGPLDQVIARLEVTAANPHWRNTWIFAAGHQFAEPQPHQHEAIVALVERIDRDAAYRLGRICPIAPGLALDLIDDGMARSHPKFHNRLLTVAFGIFGIPRLPDPLAVARVLVRAAAANDDVRTVIADALRDGLSGTSLVRETTLAVQDQIAAATKESASTHNVQGLAAVRGRPVRKSLESTRDQAWQQYRQTLADLADSLPHNDVVQRADLAIRTIAQSGSNGVDISPVIEALCDSDTAELLEMALENLLGHEPELMALLANFVLPMIHRGPVAELIRPTS
ncbi:NACHT domain-containing protein, partial [Nocardia shimofusensis]|uniref:NACHT domain-containing protein n=1 Tax=Nocardia shimofusensis TaxID=228596 RepID=UPI000A9BB4B2